MLIALLYNAVSYSTGKWIFIVKEIGPILTQAACPLVQQLLPYAMHVMNCTLPFLYAVH